MRCKDERVRTGERALFHCALQHSGKNDVRLQIQTRNLSSQLRFPANLIGTGEHERHMACVGTRECIDEKVASFFWMKPAQKKKPPRVLQLGIHRQKFFLRTR